MMVVTSLLVGQVILLEASLSFLGLGLPPGAPAWGIMVSEGKDEILHVWWLSLFPGVAITVVVLAVQLLRRLAAGHAGPEAEENVGQMPGLRD